MLVNLAVLALACFRGVVAQLPPYNGTYGVGYMSIEVPVVPQTIAPNRIAATAQAAFYLETVLFSVYYPADKNNQSTKPSPPWVQNLDLISQGIAASLNGSVSAQLISVGLGALVGNAVIPAFRDVPITGSGAFPVYVFSGGDASLPDWYSHFLGSIAADGNVVVGINHRDGSGAGSQVIVKGRTPKNVPYITADELIPVVNATGLAMIERQFRAAEVNDVLGVLKQINDGQGLTVYNNNSRGDGAGLGDWAGRLDLNNTLVLGGHSFGATSSLDSVQTGTIQGFKVRGGLVLDIGKASGPLSTDIKTSMLIADSQNWTETSGDLYGQDYFTVVKSIAQGSLNATNAGWFMTLLGTAHSSITDAGLIAGTSLLSIFDPGAANATLPLADAVNQYVDASTQYLRYLKNGKVGDILALKASDPVFVPRPANSSRAGNESSYWEVHVAPASSGTSTSGSGPSSSGSAGGSASSSSTAHSDANLTLGTNVALMLGAFVVLFSMV